MFFAPHRKKLPNGAPREHPEEAAVDMMTKHFMEEAAWANGCILLLERHLYDLKKRCEQCPYRDQEGSGCNDQIPD